MMETAPMLLAHWSLGNLPSRALMVLQVIMAILEITVLVLPSKCLMLLPVLLSKEITIPVLSK
jgi:hypothetical protein